MNPLTGVRILLGLAAGIFSAAGCASEGVSDNQCGDEPSQGRIPLDQGPSVGVYDFNDPAREPVVWTISGITDSDCSTDQLRVQLSGATSAEPLIIELDLTDGATITQNGITMTVHHSASGIQLTVSYRYDAVDTNGNLISPSIFSLRVIGPNGTRSLEPLYKPVPIESSPPVQDVCIEYPSPVIEASNVTMRPNPFMERVTVGQEIRVSIPADAVRDCAQTNGLEWEESGPGNPLQVFFRVDNIDNLAQFDNETGEYFYVASINTAGNQRILMTLRDSNRPAGNYVTLDSGTFFIGSSEAVDSTPPSAIIGSTLEYSYDVGQTAENIVCRTDTPEAVVAWTITRPELLDLADPTSYLQHFDGPVIPSYTFDALGNYDFTCVVTTADGSYTNYDTRTVGVYPEGVTETLPPAPIVGPSWAREGEEVSFVSPSADTERYTYAWRYMDGSPDEYAEGPTPPPHRFTRTGKFPVTLTVTDIETGAVRHNEWEITIVPAEVETPSLTIVAPPAVHEDIPFTLSVPEADEENFTYSWDFGDGTGLGSGAVIEHTYDRPGNMAVILTVASREHPEITFTTPIYYIYVIAADAPLPELTLEAPFSAQVDQAVVYQLAEELNLDDFDYTLDFGDGETAVVIDSSVSHTYHATGIFQAVLTAVSLRDGTTYRQTFNITIVPYPVPNVGIDGPTHAVFRTPVALNVIDPTPGTTYTWNCGNGGPAITGTSATCTYMETGRVQVILTGDNHGTINTSFHFISIHE